MMKKKGKTFILSVFFYWLNSKMKENVTKLTLFCGALLFIRL